VSISGVIDTGVNSNIVSQISDFNGIVTSIENYLVLR